MDNQKPAPPPLEPEKWSEAALATLYRATVSFGTQEQQLIWTRYTGFLVLNGFLLSAHAEMTRRLQGDSPPDPWTLTTIALIALLINSIWHTMNFSGWQNQNFWFHLAATLTPRLDAFYLPTDPWRKFKPPFGWIYWLAQTIPTGLSVVAAVVLYGGLRAHLPATSQCVC